MKIEPKLMTPEQRTQLDELARGLWLLVDAEVKISVGDLVAHILALEARIRELEPAALAWERFERLDQEGHYPRLDFRTSTEGRRIAHCDLLGPQIEHTHGETPVEALDAAWRATHPEKEHDDDTQR